MEARVCDFVSINLPNFLGFQVGKDLHKFIDEVKYVIGVMSVTGSDR